MMKTKLNGILTLLLALLVQITFAQEKTISGTVSDEGGPLPGVNVIVKGTANGTQSDFDGNYTLKATVGDVVVFSYVGMETIEKIVGSSNIINVTMVGSNLLEEVVVVGYGTSTKQAFTGSAITVKSENLEVKSVTNVVNALAGEVSGVQVINTSGQPGTTPTVRIRGIGSVNGNRSPLYVVDGVPFSGNLNSISPSDIKTTTVLKDASATAIYGARGANGVILITTKSGGSGDSTLEVSYKTGYNYSLLPRNNTIKSPEQYIELTWEGLYNRGVATGEADPNAYANANLFDGSGIAAHYNLWNVPGDELIDPSTGQVKSGVERTYNPENWEDYGFQTSMRNEATISMSGGDEKTKYFSSFGYLNDAGYIINSDYTRYTTRLNLTHQVKPWLKASANLGYALSETNDNGQSTDSGSIFWFVDNIPAIYPLFLRDASGTIIEDPVFGGNQYDYGLNGRGFGLGTNSVADATFDQSRSKRNELNGNFSFDVTITDKFSFETRFGLQYYNDKYHSLNNPFYGSSAGQGGSIYKEDNELFSYNLLNLFRYKNNFGEHSLEVLAAQESNSWKRSTSYASKSKAVHPTITELDNFIIVSSPPGSYTDEATLESYFSQVNYNYQDKYFFSGSVRRDGSSRFVGDNKWDTFGSAGLSWIISKESFMDNQAIFDNLKYKISYGLVGEQAGVGLYPGYNLYTSSNLNDNIAITESQIGNPELTWETSKMFQTGVEMTFLDIFKLDVDYYSKNTENLLFDRRVGPSVGYALITVNDGQLRNSGLEFNLTANVIDKGDYKFDINLNGAFNKNELIKMPIDPATDEEKIIDIAGAYGRATGHSIYDYYVREWAGVDPADGRSMWYTYYHDANGNGALDSDEEISSLFEYKDANPDNAISKTTTHKYADATQKYVGKSTIPKVRGAFRLSGKVKDFTISAQFLYSLGGYSYDYGYASLMSNGSPGGANWNVDILDRWQEPGDITDVPRLSADYDTNVSSRSTRFITSSDYLSLNNINIGYNLPKSIQEKLGMNINIFLSGDNLFLLSARDGFNPSTSETGSSDRYTYSPLTTFTLGIRAKF